MFPPASFGVSSTHLVSEAPGGRACPVGSPVAGEWQGSGSGKGGHQCRGSPALGLRAWLPRVCQESICLFDRETEASGLQWFSQGLSWVSRCPEPLPAVLVRLGSPVRVPEQRAGCVL